jgi:Protein of unknown function (DUF1186)
LRARSRTRAFPLLCCLALDGEAIEAVLGDGITITLKQILIRTYDGDLDTLKGLIEAAEADEYVRTAALAALVCGSGLSSTLSSSGPELTSDMESGNRIRRSPH